MRMSATNNSENICQNSESMFWNRLKQRNQLLNWTLKPILVWLFLKSSKKVKSLYPSSVPATQAWRTLEIRATWILLFRSFSASQNLRAISTQKPLNTWKAVQSLLPNATNAKFSKLPKDYIQANTARKNWHKKLTQMTKKRKTNQMNFTKMASDPKSSRTFSAKTILSLSSQLNKMHVSTWAICSTGCTKVRLRPKPARTQVIYLLLTKRRGSSATSVTELATKLRENKVLF